MTPNEPFFVLISPSVADLGHAYVIAESINHPSPGFADLQQQCDYLQKLARQDDPASCLAVERQVTQWSTSQRNSKEWLVCSALPQDLKAADTVHAVLRELWSQIYDTEDETSAIWLKKATQKQGSVFHAPRMTEITQTFRSHPKIRSITWLPILPTPSKPPQPPKKSHHYKMKTLITLIGLLAVWGATKKNGTTNDPQTGPPVANTPSPENMNWNEWHDILSNDDRWKQLIEETGGDEAFKAWETAKKAAEIEAKQSEGSKSLFGSKPKSSQGPNAQVALQKKEAVKKLDEWRNLYGKEFDVLGSSPKDVNNSPMTGYLKKAKSPWHQNIDDQISNEKSKLPKLENAAKDLEEFASLFGKSDTPEQMRRIWRALKTFSESAPNDDVKLFQDVVKQELESLTPPPKNYKMLTLKDVERVKRLKNIFGSEEFGLITGRRFDKEEQWNIIKKSMESAIFQIERMIGSERALLEGLKIVFDSAAPAKPATLKAHDDK